MTLHSRERLELPRDLVLEGKDVEEIKKELEEWVREYSRALEDHYKYQFFDVTQLVKIIARTATSADLSGAASTTLCVHTERDATLEKCTLLYTEASSADAGVTVEIGKESDRDFYYTGTTEVSKAQWYSLDVTLLNSELRAGDTLTFYSAGGKAGAGEIMLVTEYSFD